MAKKSLYLITLSLLIGLILTSSLAWAEEKGGASAFTDGTSMNLQNHPGHFTIPAGKKAINLKFEYHSPQGEYYENGVGINLADGQGNTFFFPNLPTVLEPGDYILTVGINPGLPGAWGSIYYDLE